MTLAQWIRVPLPPNGRLLATVSLPGDGEAMFASTTVANAYGFFRSLDQGASWQPVTVAGHPNPSIASVRVSLPPAGPQPRLYATVILPTGSTLNTFCDVIVSDDLGDSWKTKATNTTVCGLGNGDMTDSMLFGFESGGEIGAIAARLFRSSDGGSTWIPVVTGLPQGSIGRVNVAADGTVVVVTSLTIGVSRDRGNSWAASTLPAFTDYRVVWSEPRTLPSDVIPRPDGHGGTELIAASTTGVYRSADGLSWEPMALQGFFVLSASPAEPGSPDLVFGFRGGAALWHDGTLAAYSNGLPDLTRSNEAYRCTVPSTCLGGRLPSTAWLIEYHNTILDHYFMTADPAEAAAIDAGRAGPGWSRTGDAYLVYASVLGTLGFDVSAACRFYGTPGRGPNSHFLTVDAKECAAVMADPGWSLETAAAYAAPVPVFSPVALGNTCFGRTPIYRFYNNRAAQNDSNHRYTATLTAYQAMQAQGWINEGIRLCAIR